MPATTTRRAPGATGCCAPPPAARTQLQIMYGLGRRAAADRMRGAVAARLRGLAAGAHRQRRARPAPARRLRRGDGRAAPGARAAALEPRRGLGAPARAARPSRDDLARADEGIWEVRGERQHFTHSKVMAWVAFDRAIKSVEDVRLAGPGRAIGGRCAQTIHEEVCAQGFDAGAAAASCSPTASKQLDASLLLHPAGRLPAARRPARARHRRGDRAAT